MMEIGQLRQVAYFSEIVFEISTRSVATRSGRKANVTWPFSRVSNFFLFYGPVLERLRRQTTLLLPPLVAQKPMI